eukprot:9474579-Pyramimonas_sp.AAC.1
MLTGAGMFGWEGLGYTGMMAAVYNPWAPPGEWEVGGVPIHRMMTMERRKGRDKAVIKKAMVDLQVSGTTQ